jgi:hypothetical protein
MAASRRHSAETRIGTVLEFAVNLPIGASNSEAPEERHRVARGEAAEQPQPRVTIHTNPLFSSFAPTGRRMMKKGKNATTAPNNNPHLFYKPTFLIRRTCEFSLMALITYRTFTTVRAHGMWTYEPRQGRKAATVVCSTSAVVTLALPFATFRFTKGHYPTDRR